MGDPRQSDLGRGISSINWGQNYGGAAAPVMSALAGGNGTGDPAGNAAIFQNQLNTQRVGNEAEAARRKSEYDAGIVAQQNSARNAANQANQNYLNQQSTLAQSTADEDAYTAARNAARKAKGTTLFGAWG